MGKSKDLISVLAIVIIGMFIPFFISINITFGLNITNIDSLFKIVITFGWFLIIFGFELAAVYLYFHITNKTAKKKFDKLKLK
ncbi:hypothetical protein AYK24_05050 [Thermoplasmatales archaeon SG8-52-4]|nr:MAG: hypothetical protein AYK24_05050 [Thermoplasmatales archaeon SG8-52-4]